jgi:excisionase family DNA binding protein
MSTTSRNLPDPASEPTVSVERAGQLLGISRGCAYVAARAGDIPAIRIGRKRLVVPTAALLRLLGVESSP